MGKGMENDMKNAPDLYTMLQLMDVLKKDDEIVYIRKENDERTNKPSIIISVKELKEKWDLRKTKVTGITDYWCCCEFEGMLLTVKE